MFQVLNKLLEFEENTLKPIMAQGYSRSDAMVVAWEQLDEQLAH